VKAHRFSSIYPRYVQPEEIVGYKILTLDGLLIGQLVEVLHQIKNDIWVIDIGGREVLVPAVHEIIKRIDKKTEQVSIVPVDGLVD